MYENKEGIVEAVSMKTFAVKFEGMEGWFGAKNQAVKDAIKKINKGDKVEYNIKQSENSVNGELIFIKEKGFMSKDLDRPKFSGKSISYSEPQNPEIMPIGAQPPQKEIKIDYRGTMEKTITEVNAMMGLISDVEIRKTLGWAAIINTLFIAKTSKK